MIIKKLIKWPPSALIVLLLFFIALPATSVPVKPSALITDIAFSDATLSQGNLLVLRLTTKVKHIPRSGLFRDKQVIFFEDNGSYLAVIGAAVDADNGINLLEVTLNENNKKGSRSIKKFFPIIIEKKEFGVSRITVSKNMVTPNKKELQRIAREQRLIKSALSKPISEKLWKGAFIRPVKGSVSSAFGKKRFLNNKPRSPHSGLDFRSPMGTKILAPNSGKVALTGEHYFSGKTIILDHGGGLLSFYYHLSKINVMSGDKVKKGDILGLVGSTGRSTGPHLHWGVTLNNIKSSPLSLLRATEKLENNDLVQGETVSAYLTSPTASEKISESN